MKGDFSRLPGGGGYSGVWMQQGRIQLDQDWNEQHVLAAGHAAAALRDLVGAAGAPAADPGFRVRARGGVHCGGTLLQAELELASPAGELTVEARVLAVEGAGGGVLVEVEGWFTLSLDAAGRPAFRGGGSAIVSPEPLPPGVPVLVSAAYDGRAAVLHLDGRPVAAALARLGAAPGPGARLRLGGSAGADGEVQAGFGGVLDEVRLWGHARTPAQLRDDAGRTLTGREAGLAAWFPLDEGEGATARDAVAGRLAVSVGELRWAAQELVVGSGRMYVDGIACVAPREAAFHLQPDLPGILPPPPGRHLVYLDVWERYLSAAEDAGLREVALGGLDTTGRTRTVCQARTLPLGPDQGWNDALLALRRGRLRSAMSARRAVPAAPAAGNRLYRVEVHGSGGLYGWPRLPGDTRRAARVVAVDDAPGGGGTLTLRAGRGDFEAMQPGARVEVFSRATDQAGQPGTLAHVTAVDPWLRQVTVDALPPGLAPGDEPRVRPIATFLWSEDNAWQAWPVRHLDRQTGRAVLGDVGPEGLALAAGDLVELSDERTVLLSRPGLLLSVKDVDPETETVTLSAPVAWPPEDGGGRPLLRRWACGRGPADALPARMDQWTALSDGVEVRFEGTALRTTDYWTVPMRVAAPGGLEWPRWGTRAAALPPQGIEHHYAALALVVVHPHDHHPDRHRLEVQDLRQIFSPLTSLTAQEHHHHHHHHPCPEPVAQGGDVVDVTVVDQSGEARVAVTVRPGGDGGETVDVRVGVGPERDPQHHRAEHADRHHQPHREPRADHGGEDRAHRDRRDQTADRNHQADREPRQDHGGEDRAHRDRHEVRVDRNHGEDREHREVHDREDRTHRDDLKDRQDRKDRDQPENRRHRAHHDHEKRHAERGDRENPADRAELADGADRKEHDRADGADRDHREDPQDREDRDQPESRQQRAHHDHEDRHAEPGDRENPADGADRAHRDHREDSKKREDRDQREDRENRGHHHHEDRHAEPGDRENPAGRADPADGADRADPEDREGRNQREAREHRAHHHREGPGEQREERGDDHARGHAPAAVPAGFWIFGETHAAPEGWSATGARMRLAQEAPAWGPRAPLPGPVSGPVRCVVVRGDVFALREGAGEVLRYDPPADAWRVETRLPEEWRAYAAAALDGRIHLVGGRDAKGRMVRWHRAWDPATGEWETREQLGSARAEMGAASLGGRLYVAGGVRALLSMTTDAVDAYDPGTDRWTGCRGMGHARSSPAVTAAAGRLYVVGGRQPGMGTGRPSEHVEAYDPVRGRWKELDAVPTPCRDAALAELDGVLHLVGGDAGAGATGLTQSYSLRGGGWMLGPSLGVARAGHGLAAFSGRLCAVGGAGDGAADSAEECRLFFDLHGFRKE